MEFDYKKLGFRCGLEFHQEFDVGKLFCRCDSSFNENKLVFEVERKLRPTPGESGEIDRAVFYEFLRDRTFVYHGYKNEACLVDVDGEPPKEINKRALDIAFQLSIMLNMKIPDVIKVMRKTVTDGSAPCGFQRTALVSVGVDKSFVKTSKGDVRVQSLNVEEDSCKIEKKEGGKVYYSCSRLGIPLIELGTETDILDPEHAFETAMLFGRLFRSFKDVKRGIGTIRQDVNVSIKGGARVEVKGFQDISKLRLLIEQEVERQYNLIQIKNRLNKNKIQINTAPKDVTYLFKDTKCKVILNSIRNKGVVYGLVLTGLAGFLKEKLYGAKTLGKELAEYAVAYGVKGMIHTDEDLNKYGLNDEFHNLCVDLGAKLDDLVLIVTGESSVAKKAIESVLQRAKLLPKLVPEETRIPNHVDATSSYARPLPGGDRMYPETDVCDIIVDQKYLNLLKKTIPETVESKQKRFIKNYGLNFDMSRILVESNYVYLFDELVNKYGKKFALKIANLFVNVLPDLKTRYGVDLDCIGNSVIDDVFLEYSKGNITFEAISAVLNEIYLKKCDVKKAISVLGLKCLSKSEAQKLISKLVSLNKDKSMGAVMGVVMGELKGKIDGAFISECVKKCYLEK
jgi:glutamyl-tRNA(Gln) amidotransferase subunit E